MEDVIKIAVLDDHPIVREGIEIILSSVEYFKVILQLEGGKGLLKFLEKIDKTDAECPDVLILDIQLPDISGYDLLEKLRDYPQIRVLVYSMFENEYSVIKMLHSGARGFLTKGGRPGEIIDAIERVMDDELVYPHYISPDAVERIRKGYVKVGLTEREIEFLRYCCQDLGYKEIAAKMNLSDRTIHHYRDTLFLKLGVKSKTGLAMYATNAGFTPYKEDGEG